MLRAASAVAAMRCCSPLTCWSDDLHDLPLIERNWRLIGKAQSRAIRFNEHLTGGGPTIFKHVCQMGLEGIVSKRTDAPYRERTIEDVAQVEELGERGGAPGARGGWR
jgi:hypothetical protein